MILHKDENQRVYYDPGVGVAYKTNILKKGKQKAKAFVAMATGCTVDEKVQRAYEFLIDTYQKGDRIYLFGYSRGAHTIRVLSVLLTTIGLLHADQRNLAGIAVSEINEVANRKDTNPAKEFGAKMSARKVMPYFENTCKFRILEIP